LSDGDLKNVGHPYELIADSSSVLSQLMKKLTKDEQNQLAKIAELSFETPRNHQFDM
jgi:hypothetical protein